jgi:hypothetical protein
MSEKPTRTILVGPNGLRFLYQWKETDHGWQLWDNKRHCWCLWATCGGGIGVDAHRRLFIQDAMNAYEELLDEIEQLKQSQEHQWGIACEAHMVEIENVVARANEDTCCCDDETSWGAGECPSCEMHELIRNRLHWSQSVNRKSSTFNSTEKVNSEDNKDGKLEPTEKDG